MRRPGFCIIYVPMGPDAISSIPAKFLGRQGGLPSAQVHKLVQSTDGRIWAATPAGLVCYDGMKIRVFTQRHGLQTHGLRTVDVAPDGRLWIGSDTGIDIFHEGRALPISAAWAYGFVGCICHQANTTWLGTSKGLLRVVGSNYEPVADPRLNGKWIRAIAAGENGNLLVAVSGGGLLFGNGETWRELLDSVPEQSREVRVLSPGPAGHLFAGGDFGFVELDRDGEVLPGCAKGLDSKTVTALEYRDGELWVAGNEELRIFENFGAEWKCEHVVMRGVPISDLMADDMGNIWAATDGRGIAKFSVCRKAINPVRLGTPCAVFCVCAGNDDRLLVGGTIATHVVNPETEGTVWPVRALDAKHVWDILEETDGTIYAATASGLVRLDRGHKPSVLGADDPVLSRPNRCLLKRGAQMFVGTVGGCVIVGPDGSIVDVTTADGSELGYVYTLTLDRQGRVWAGTLGQGLWVMEQDVFERVTGEGLTVTGNTYSVEDRDDGTIAVVQDDRICLISPAGQVRTLARRDEAVAAWCSCWDDDGTLWLGTSCGLVQYHPESGRQLRHIAALLSVSDWEFTTSRSLHRMRNGDFYCGLQSGLVRVNSKRIVAFERLPELKVDSINWLNTEPTLSDGIYRVERGHWTLTVNVFATWFLDEGDVSIRHRLLGLDEKWRPLSQTDSIIFSSLSPGQYRLQAQAFSPLAGFGPVLQVMEFVVETPRWVKQWMRAPMGLFNAFRRINAALFKNRELLERNLQLENEIRERLADLQQAKNRLESLNSELENEVITDALTGISNRRHFDRMLVEVLAEARQEKKPLSLIMVDIDFFKGFNDRYGHARGDDVLRFVARNMNSSLYRPTDKVARYGGEEFVVVAPHTDSEGAKLLAERLRTGVRDLAIAHAGSERVGVVSISLGVTTLTAAAMEGMASFLPEQLVREADKALYLAKDMGRDCWVFKAPGGPPESRGPVTVAE